MPYTTALVMIARNESRCIRRALHSLRPWVDHLVVLDTGSSDDTVALARAEGAQVHSFCWCDDFAAARNAALDFAQAQTHANWHIVVDADEWLTAGHEALAALRHTAPTFVGSIEVDSSFEDAGRVAQAPSWLPRVLPSHVRYAGRIHEHPEHTLPTQRLPIHLGHDGYLAAPMQAKGDRNLQLLTRALQDHPGDAYLLYQLGKDHDVHQRYADAAQAYQQALPHCPASAPWRHDLVVRTLFALKQAGHVAEAVQLATAELPHWGHSADFHFTLGDVLLSHALALPEAQAAEVLPMIESCWLHCIELGDTLQLEGAVAGRGSHLAAHNLAVFYDSLGQREQAQRWWPLAQPGTAPHAAAAAPTATPQPTAALA